MKLSDTPTDFLIFRARTDSEWDYCDFAIVQIDEFWMNEQRKRLAFIKVLDKDCSFHSMHYYEGCCQFYQDVNNLMIDSMEVLKEKHWSYLETNEAEIETLSLPDNTLDCHLVVLKSGGYGMFTCYGKHTDDQFWTDDFPIHALLNNVEPKLKQDENT